VTSPQILVVDDEPSLRTVLSANLKRQGYIPMVAEDGAVALKILNKEVIEVVVTDLRMPNMDGMELLGHIVDKYPNIPVIMITAHGTVDTAVEAMKKGAFDYITKPFEQSEFKLIIAKAVATNALAAKQITAASEGEGRFGLIGATSIMHELYEVVDKVADSPSTVLITGESGTGKELIARALHENSNRVDRPFIRINCAAIPKDLIESELFGYEKGAFTGAVSSKPGRFELAHNGTLFLDEIGSIPLEMQVKLLRAIQEKEFERVGGIRTIRVDVRLIAATNQNLEDAISDGRFREDLFYRLNVVPVRMPALRERKEDIRSLCTHIITKYNERLKKQVKDLSGNALNAFLNYDWPGNIRELENVLERMILFTNNNELQLEDVPKEIRAAAPAGATVEEVAASADAVTRGLRPLKEVVKETTVRLEREIIMQALKETGGNVTRAAQVLQISRKSLQNKMKEFDLRDAEY
jgi:nitrogen regulation protein NR(I)